MLRRLLVALLVPALLALTPATADGADRADRKGDPRLHRKLYVNTDNQAYRAAKRDHRFDPIGMQPMAQMLSESWFPTSEARQRVHRYAKRAKRHHRTPLVALYAIPGRDCGSYSAGGLSPAEYKKWVRQIAKGLKGMHAMAILEPDALGHYGACSGQGDRLGLLRYATKKLSKAGVWVYIDAAHTAWIKPSVMTRRLIKAGVRMARGFSVNVASFVRTDLEKKYAKKILKGLRKRGVGKKHYVMDTSRNGNGQATGNDWCNPTHARIGRPPEVVAQRKLDAYLWVKTPGESDGPCNGGPYAGAEWPEGALGLKGP